MAAALELYLERAAMPNVPLAPGVAAHSANKPLPTNLCIAVERNLSSQRNQQPRLIHLVAYRGFEIYRPVRAVSSCLVYIIVVAPERPDTVTSFRELR
jgi:hypothetical protein